jgi:hypothetical protein
MLIPSQSCFSLLKFLQIGFWACEILYDSAPSMEFFSIPTSILSNFNFPTSLLSKTQKSEQPNLQHYPTMAKSSPASSKATPPRAMASKVKSPIPSP